MLRHICFPDGEPVVLPPTGKHVTMLSILFIILFTVMHLAVWLMVDIEK